MRPFLQLAHPPMPLPWDPSALVENLPDSGLLSSADKNLEEACKSIQSLLKQRMHPRALGVEGVEQSWQADAKGILRAAVGARLGLKRVKDWWESRETSRGHPKADIQVKIPNGRGEGPAKGLWIDWSLPEINTTNVRA